MTAFNFILSSERITIERAFGMLVMKWGILQKSLKYSLKLNAQIIMTCVKLHNLCVDEWIETKREDDYDFQRSFIGEVQEMGTQNTYFDSLRNPYDNEEETDDRARQYGTTPKRQRIGKFASSKGLARVNAEKYDVSL
jgi:hypothetical protein